MLDMGFEPQIRRLVERSGLPPTDARATLLFSATFSNEMKRVAEAYLRQPYARVEVGRVGSSTSAIEQRLVLASDGSRKAKPRQLLLPLVDGAERSIVFCGKKHVCAIIRKRLATQGVRAVEIHGDRSQSQREAALADFRAGAATCLVATDVAARGLDVPDVAHVIQFDLPNGKDDFDAYVHRIGRTGRAGKTGKATALFVPGDEPKVGNGALWLDLHRTFGETKQHLPPWFDGVKPPNVRVPGAAPEKSARRKGASPPAAPGARRRRSERAAPNSRVYYFSSLIDSPARRRTSPLPTSIAREQFNSSHSQSDCLDVASEVEALLDARTAPPRRAAAAAATAARAPAAARWSPSRRAWLAADELCVSGGGAGTTQSSAGGVIDSSTAGRCSAASGSGAGRRRCSRAGGARMSTTQARRLGAARAARRVCASRARGGRAENAGVERRRHVRRAGASRQVHRRTPVTAPGARRGRQARDRATATTCPRRGAGLASGPVRLDDLRTRPSSTISEPQRAVRQAVHSMV